MKIMGLIFEHEKVSFSGLPQMENLGLCVML